MNQPPLVQRITAVLWPSFLMASLATIVTFAFIDPVQMMMCYDGLEVSYIGAYTVGFFGFWLLTTLSSATSCYFVRCNIPQKIQVNSE